MNLQTRIGILLLCLLLTVGAIFYMSRSTFRAIQTVQQRQTMVHRDDVRLVQQWMTIPYISRQYQIPEENLYAALKLNKPATRDHRTLQMIATQRKESVDSIIHILQQTISDYHKTHPTASETATVLRGEIKIY